MKQKSNFPKFMLLWAGELISAIGGGLTSFGLGVYVFGQTGSAASMALITLLAFLPTLLLSVPAGVLADRYDRRLLMMLGIGETICASGMLVSSRFQIGVGRGAAWVVMAAGVLLGLTAAVLYLPKSVRGLEKEAPC